MSRRPPGAAGDFAHKVHDETRRFAQTLMSENERLRRIVAELQSEKVLLEERLLAMKEEQFRHERERHRLERELAQIETENQGFTKRYLEVERQSSLLTNLYVAAHQLHATLDRSTVLASVQEIVANLIGSEQVAIFERAPSGAQLRLVASSGIDKGAYDTVAIGTGPIGRAAQTGETFIAADEADEDGATDADGLTACIPLVLEDSVTGAIAIFRLLPQKTALEEADRELFGVLAIHAATALYGATLREQTQAAPSESVGAAQP